MALSDIDLIKKDIMVLQNRIGGAEFLIKALVLKMHPNEVKAIENEIIEAIQNHGADSAVADILNESLRLLGE